MTFFDKTGSIMGQWIDVSHIKSCIPQIDISNKAWCALNRDCMPKLHPREVDLPIFPNGARSFGTSSPRVRFLDV